MPLCSHLIYFSGFSPPCCHPAYMNWLFWSMKVCMTNQALHWWGEKATSGEASLRLQSSPGDLSCLIDIFIFEVKPKLMGIALKAFYLWRLDTISVKKLNLPSTGRLFKSVAGRADFTINKYHICVHMQLPIMGSIPVKSAEFCVCKGSGKFCDTFLMAAATKCNSFPTCLEYLIWHFSLRSCNI